MTRVVLTVFLPLLLPTALYLLWAFVFGRTAAGGGVLAWRGIPWLWLVVAGTGLAAAVLFGFVELGGNGRGIYVPPHFEKGRIVPGHVEPAAPKRS